MEESYKDNSNSGIEKATIGKEGLTKKGWKRKKCHGVNEEQKKRKITVVVDTNVDMGTSDLEHLQVTKMQGKAL